MKTQMAIRALSRGRGRAALAALSAACVFHAVVHASPVPDRVSLRESTIAWSTVKYATNTENGLVSGSLDKNTIVDRTFRTRVLENRYRRSRWCLNSAGHYSIIYKPTGHEESIAPRSACPTG